MTARPHDLAGFRGLHDGETLVVCGCGASLNDLRSPERFITIGVNDVGRRFDPTYLVVLNPRDQFRGDRFQYVEQSRARTVFTQLDLRLRHPHVVRFRLGRRGGNRFDDPNVLHYTSNSPYVAVCLAVHLGAARIGLIGVDFTDHHFFAETGRHPLHRRLAAIDREYGRLTQACEAHGIELVNLSRQSRLTLVPKRDVESFEPVPPARRDISKDIPRRNPMSCLAIELHRPGIIGDFMDALARTAGRLGWKVRRMSGVKRAGREELAVLWNGRSFRSTGPTLYCEHGWLPRWDYQVSPFGINADSHIAPFIWDGKPLDSGAKAELDRRLEEIRQGGPESHAYMQTAAPAAGDLPEEFLLVPLQLEVDTNILRHVPDRYRRMQALVDDVARSQPPWPVVYKQHPVDARRGNTQLRLRTGRRQDSIRPHDQGNIHQLLKSGRCRGIVSLNSNVVHDGMLWGVPAVVLGRNIWPQAGPGPFLTSFPQDWQTLSAQLSDLEVVACREAYARYLMNHQWTLQDMRDPERVNLLLSTLPSLARPSRVAVAPVAIHRSRPSAPRINVVAVDRGWLFEDLKRHYGSVARGDLTVVASQHPRKDADAWIFLRTKEAAASPSPDRTVVQIHDMFDSSLYRPGGERSCVARCGGVVLTHPDQRALLTGAGIDLAGKEVLLRPIGALKAFQLREALPPRFTVGWVGRPVEHGGIEVKRAHWFVEAVTGLKGDLEVVLLGERLEQAHREIQRAGIPCAYHHRSQNPIDRYPQHYQSFDCLVISALSDAGPLCLFESLATGAPVVSTAVGWSPILIQDGENGRLVASVEEITAALAEIRRERQAWFEKRECIRQSLQGHTLESWVEASLDMALRLASASRIATKVA